MCEDLGERIHVATDHTGTQIYDLKGSTRNRHVQSTGRENEVLLDENLVQRQFSLSSVAFVS
jgi:hypothetical protein